MSKNGPSLPRRRLIQAISMRTQICQPDVELVLDALIAIVTQAVRDGLTVTFLNFGTFGVTKYKAQRFVDAKGKQERILPPRVVPGFKPAEKYTRDVRKAFQERAAADPPPEDLSA